MVCGQGVKLLDADFTGLERWAQLAGILAGNCFKPAALFFRVAHDLKNHMAEFHLLSKSYGFLK